MKMINIKVTEETKEYLTKHYGTMQAGVTEALRCLRRRDEKKEELLKKLKDRLDRAMLEGE